MNKPLVKAYGSVYPASDKLYLALSELLDSWHLGEALSRKGDMLLISHEGIYFPAQETADLLKAHLHEDSQGKLDYLDLENWQLHRYLIMGTHLAYRTASLDQALDSCGRTS